MSGGDLRIRNEGVSGLGQSQQLEVIDAHSAQSGDFTEERKVGRDTVFLTPEGAAAHDALVEQEFTFLVERDGGFWNWLMGAGRKEQQHPGTPGDEP